MLREIPATGGAERLRARFAAIMEAAEDAIVEKDLKGIVTDWNRGAETIFGYTAEEMIGQSITRIIPASRLDEEADILRRISRGERVLYFETVRRTKDGRLIDALVSVTPIRDASGTVTGASKILRNITAQKERNREFARLTRLYSALSQVNQGIVFSATREELFNKVCRVLVEYGGFQMVWVGLLDEATRRIVPVAADGQGTDYAYSIEVYADDRPEGLGPCGRAFRTGKPCVCDDVESDPAMLPWSDALRRHGFRSSAAFPIRAGDTVCGLLTIYSGEPGFFRDREIGLLAEASGDVSFALANLIEKEERRQAEKAAEAERDFSEMITESLPGILYFYDEKLRFLRWNKNFETFSGYASAEIAGMGPLEFFSDAEKPLIAQRIGEVFERGQSSVEASFVAKDGTATPYFFTGKRVIYDGTPCLVGMGVDISGRKRAEELQLRSEGRYRTLFESAPDGILIADTEARYLDANSGICHMLGYTRDELVGMHSSQIVEPSEIEHIAPALDTVRLKACYHREWILRRKDGSAFPADVIATVMPDGNILGMIRDATERKASEEAMRRLNENLEHEVAARTADLQAALVRAEAADRIKSAFLATMSHELRTPLNSIIGFTGIVLQGLAGPLNSEQTKQLGMVRSSARHLLELINDVLDLSKIEAGQLEIRAEPFDLRASIEHVADLVRPLAEKKHLVLTVTMPDNPGQMTSDPRRVQQILLNLLNNAIKFTERGEVTLSVDLLQDETLPDVRLRVTDTGTGIRKENLSSLFLPFRQLDSGFSRQHEGTGLGLAICKRLAGLLGGRISAESEWRKGSVFTVFLPLLKPATS